jgi:hypothetical protein
VVLGTHELALCIRSMSDFGTPEFCRNHMVLFCMWLI